MTKPISSDPAGALDIVGKKRVRTAEMTPQRQQKKNRQDDVIKAMGDRPCTERHILEAVGDNRYTREILRRLMALSVVTRVGKGGSNDPFLYRVVKGACIEDLLLVDPALEVRLQRIEVKISALLREAGTSVTEKHIRSLVGDNTGTGKALRRLVNAGRVIREGRGGAGNPFTYRVGADCPEVEEPAPTPTPARKPAPAVVIPASPKPKPHRKVAVPAVRVVATKEEEEEEEEEERAASPRSFSGSPSSPVQMSNGMVIELGSAATSATDKSSRDASDSESDDGSDSESEADTEECYLGRLSESEEEDHPQGADIDLGMSDDSPSCISHHDAGAGEGCIEMGDLTVVGKACGIVVDSVEEALALSNPTPASDALVASFLA